MKEPKGIKRPHDKTSNEIMPQAPLHIDQAIVDTLKTNFMPYAMSVIVSRAIPEIDGLKPSHRKLLYTMYKMGLLKGARTKSSNVVGQTMRLNPHGDQAIYDTMVRLTTGNQSLLHPLVDSKGNFGRVYSRDMKNAAARYTEVKLEPICELLFKDIDKDAVDFVDNFDSTTKEPLLLPSAFPNILVNPNQGIAVGMASNICSFNLMEVCDAITAYIQEDSIDWLQYLPAPDFSTGGQIIVSDSELRRIYATGRGSFKVRAKYRIDKKNNLIEVFEIPYTTTTEAIIEEITKIVKDGRIRDITDVRDETDLEGLTLTIDYKRSADPDALMQKLFRMTSLQDSFGCNFNILIDGRPMVLGIQGIVDNWIRFRMECIRRQCRFDIEKKQERLHLLSGLAKILLDIDKAIRIIRESKTEADVLPNLMKAFSIDKLQAEFVADIRLRNLNREYILRQTADIAALQKEIADLQDVLNHETRVLGIICAQLAEIRKNWGIPRRSELLHEAHVEEITDDNLIEDYNLKLFLTRHGYLKKVALTSLRSANDHKIKEEDEIVQEIETRNKAEVLLFTDRQVVYKMRIHEIPDAKASSLGEYLQNLLQLDPDEKVLYMVATDAYTGSMLFAFQNGKMARVSLSAYATKTNRKKLANAYNGESGLVRMMFLPEDRDFAALSSIDKLLVFNTSGINPKITRDAQGVQVLKSKKGSTLVSLRTLEEIKLSSVDYYRASVPAIGCYLKEEDKEDQQVTLVL